MVVLLIFINEYSILCIVITRLKTILDVIIMLGVYLALIDEPSDKEKFTEIYNHYRDMMHRRAMSILHNTVLAEEAVQESFLKIAKNISKISSPVCSKTASFIVIIVRNTSYDILRTEKPNITRGAYGKKGGFTLFTEVQISKMKQEICTFGILPDSAKLTTEKTPKTP